MTSQDENHSVLKEFHKSILVFKKGKQNQAAK